MQYNDYSIETQPKLGKTLRLVKSIQDAGVPIAAVGIQGHWQIDHIPYSDIEHAINEFQKLGVKVMFTELDLDVVPRQAGADVAHREADSVMAESPASADLLKRQAEQYAKLFALFDKHKDAVSRVTFWGLNDDRSWLNYWPSRRVNHPLLFDRQIAAEAALQGGDRREDEAGAVARRCFYLSRIKRTWISGRGEFLAAFGQTRRPFGW